MGQLCTKIDCYHGNVITWKWIAGSDLPLYFLFIAAIWAVLTNGLQRQWWCRVFFFYKIPWELIIMTPISNYFGSCICFTHTCFTSLTYFCQTDPWVTYSEICLSLTLVFCFCLISEEPQYFIVWHVKTYCNYRVKNELLSKKTV